MQEDGVRGEEQEEGDEGGGSLPGPTEGPGGPVMRAKGPVRCHLRKCANNCDSRLLCRLAGGGG